MILVNFIHKNQIRRPAEHENMNSCIKNLLKDHQCAAGAVLPVGWNSWSVRTRTFGLAEPGSKAQNSRSPGPKNR